MCTRDSAKQYLLGEVLAIDLHRLAAEPLDKDDAVCETMRLVDALQAHVLDIANTNKEMLINAQ